MVLHEGAQIFRGGPGEGYIPVVSAENNSFFKSRWKTYFSILRVSQP